ncbi:MAG: CRTAC1 family protein [Chitinophagaceae bacterium]|nr:MAG: CRTAC1 family protein [Chitinophagaceae bacterium]
MQPRKVPFIITTIIFAVLLIIMALSSRPGLFHGEDTAIQKEAALKKYGFYLEPDNEQAGIHFRHESPQLDPKIKNIEHLIASMGASVSVTDFNQDGWDDIYFTNSRTGSQNALYRNLHNGKFENVAGQMGVADLNKKGTGVCMGAVWGDYDNDGYPDLLVYKWGKPLLFHNEGGKKLVDVTAGSGLPAWVNANCAVWFDFNRDGRLDLFIGSYYNEAFNLQDLNTTKIMPESFRYANNGSRNYLLENMGNGKFKDVTAEYGLTSTKWTLAAGTVDLNGDGYPDLFVANDYGVNQLFMNDSGKRFVEVGSQSGIGNIPKSGMCVAFGDIDDSGLIGIYNTTITEKGILIQDNNYWQPIQEAVKSPYPKFVNLAQLAGIENAGWSWGAQFGDLNNDGYQDLYVANGFISGKSRRSYWYDYAKVTSGNKEIIGDAKNWPDMKGKSLSGYEMDKIWLNNGDGTFQDVSRKVCPPATYDGRAVAMADLWNNGALDVIVANQNNIPIIYKNIIQNHNNWIELDLRGTISNADAVGAKVLVEWDGKKQMQVVTDGIGFSSENSHRLHFGLDKSNQIDRIIIYWPSGKITTLTNPQINQLHVIKEPG